MQNADVNPGVLPAACRPEYTLRSLRQGDVLRANRHEVGERIGLCSIGHAAIPFVARGGQPDYSPTAVSRFSLTLAFR